VIVRTDLRRGNEVISQCKHDEAMKANHGAQNEISIDGVPRAYRDRQEHRASNRGS
jgi:hypothetical protein